MTTRTCTGPAVPAAPAVPVLRAGSALLVSAVAAGAVALLGPAVPAVASEAGGAPGAPDTTRPRDAVTLTPASGEAGTAVAVQAVCASEPQSGAVFSPAFEEPAVLRRAPGGAMVAEATVRRDAAPGRTYVVTVNCSSVESLSASFALTADGGRDPGPVVPGSAPGPAAGSAPYPSGTGPAPLSAPRGDAGRVDGIALAFGGGLATVALAGYVLVARRSVSRRRLHAVFASRRR